MPAWTWTSDIIDHDAAESGASMYRTRFEKIAEYFTQAKQIMGTPYFSEGFCAWTWTGYVDGVEGQCGGMPEHQFPPVIPDFDLRILHTRLLHFGMGYINRILPNEYYMDRNQDGATDGYSDTGLYALMSYTLAYGHNIFLDGLETGGAWGISPTVEQTRKYYELLLPIQKRYANVPVREVLYPEGERFVNLSDYLRTHAGSSAKRYRLLIENNTFTKVRIVYNNGLDVYVNCHPNDNWIVRPGGYSMTLPPYGFAARSSAGDFMVYSAEQEGQRIDFVYQGSPTPSATPTITPTFTNTPTFSSTPTYTNSPSPIAFMIGDANCDEQITPGDALLVFHFYLRVAIPTTSPCNQAANSDWDQNGNITPGDALCIFREYLMNPCG